MLTLSRKRNQSIHIGSDVTITVVEVRKGQARLAIQAPEAIRILRAELGCPDRPAEDGEKRPVSA